MGEWRTQQITADTLEAFAIATIYRDGGVQLHAEGRDVHGAERGLERVGEHAHDGDTTVVAPEGFVYDRYLGPTT